MIRHTLWNAIIIASATVCTATLGVTLAHAESLAPLEVDPRNRASFHVEVVREVDNDWATARLSIVEEGEDPARLGDAVNRRMAKAVATAKAVAGVEIESGAYITRPIHRDGRIVSWLTQQELRLESHDVHQLSALIGKLQNDSVLVVGISFSVRNETRKSLEDELIEEALDAFRSRASLIAKGLGAQAWSLVGLSVDGDGHVPEMYPRRAMAQMAMTAKGAPPALEAGSSEIRIRVDGTIVLNYSNPNQ